MKSLQLCNCLYTYIYTLFILYYIEYIYIFILYFTLYPCPVLATQDPEMKRPRLCSQGVQRENRRQIRYILYGMPDSIQVGRKGCKSHSY